MSLMDATGRTLLQRVVSDEILARVFGVLEGLTMAALGLGSILVPALVAWFGLEGAIVAFAALLPALALLSIPGLRRIHASAVVPERELTLLAKVEMFAALRPQVLESVARRSTWMAAPAGTVLMAEGDPGDRYYVLASGRLDVTRGGEYLATLSEPGDGVGRSPSCSTCRGPRPSRSSRTPSCSSSSERISSWPSRATLRLLEQPSRSRLAPATATLGLRGSPSA